MRHSDYDRRFPMIARMRSEWNRGTRGGRVSPRMVMSPDALRAYWRDGELGAEMGAMSAEMGWWPTKFMGHDVIIVDALGPDFVGAVVPEDYMVSADAL